MNEYMREDMIKKVEKQQGRRSQLLAEFKTPSSTYYKWRKAYDEGGICGLVKAKPGPKISWNRLSPDEENKVLEIARLHPELSPRLLAIRITDQASFSVSESTVYRILKENNLILPRPLPEMPAAREWRHKTKKPDQLWQCDATNLFVVGWGYYKLIPVEDDFSRKIISWDLKPDETAFSLADIVEMAVENAEKQGHLIDKDSMPNLYTDNVLTQESNISLGTKIPISGKSSLRNLQAPSTKVLGNPFYHSDTRSAVIRP
jgi:transposase